VAAEALRLGRHFLCSNGRIVMLEIFIDIDNCPNYPHVLRAAQRHALELYVVTRTYLHVDVNVHLILAQEDGDGGRDWIASNISRGDICVTDDKALAFGCQLRGAVVLEATIEARAFTRRMDAAVAAALSVERRLSTSATFSRIGYVTAQRWVQQARTAAD
jgi:uncharacterized protein YaiI (UPF0178 family)